jgi:hypothetical protein
MPPQGEGWAFLDSWVSDSAPQATPRPGSVVLGHVFEALGTHIRVQLQG